MKQLLNTLYVTNPEAYVHVKDENACVNVERRETLKVPLHLLESIVLFGHATASTALMGLCAKRGISVVLLDERGRFNARVEGPVSGNVLLRTSQYRLAENTEFSLKASKRFIAAKIGNARRVLLRYSHDYPDSKAKLDTLADRLKLGIERVATATTRHELLGIEGDAAHVYFGAFPMFLRSGSGWPIFVGRERRPPTDPANAALSFCYTLLTREIVTACECVGLDPQQGFYHQIRPGRPSLALDLIEEFRSPYVDRFVVSLFNRRQLTKSDFEQDGEGAVFFTDNALKRVLDAWQRKKQDMVTHPFLKERMKIGLLPFVQAQLFARYIRGDLEDYPAYLWR